MTPSESGLPDFELVTSQTHILPASAASVETSLERPSRPVRSKLYISHFLSTWNSRVFEFGAVLFLSTIFPGTLLPASVYALARAASVILFSGFVGDFIDHGDRMRVVRISIGTILLFLAQKVFKYPKFMTDPDSNSGTKGRDSSFLRLDMAHGFGRQPAPLDGRNILSSPFNACMCREAQLCLEHNLN